MTFRELMASMFPSEAKRAEFTGYKGPGASILGFAAGFLNRGPARPSVFDKPLTMVSAPVTRRSEMPFGFGLGNLKVLSGSLKSFIQQPRTIQMARQAGGALAKYAPAGSRSRGLLKLAAGGGALAGAGYGLSELT